MLIERIEIESCGELERVQLGPFSPRLNAVFGTDSTAAIGFIRSVMLGSDRDWHRGSIGSVTWADLRTDLPPRAVEGLIAATRQTSLATIIAGCQDAGLDATRCARDEAEIARVRQSIAELDCQLAGYPSAVATREDLETSRRRLRDELDVLDRAALIPVAHDTHRDDLRVRLAEACDEVARLTQQESELRRLIADVERELLYAAHRPSASHWPIAAVHRRQLEELDLELTRWRRALCDISAIREPIAETGENTSFGGPISPEPAEAQLAAAAYQLARLARRYDRAAWEDAAVGGESAGETDQERTAVASYLAAADVDAVADALRLARRELQQLQSAFEEHRLEPDGDRHALDAESAGRCGVVLCDGGAANLRRCEEVLVWAIDRLIESRHALLRQIAAEYNLPLSQLIEAFGDWQQCHNHPQLYQWLLSDKCPPRADDMLVQATRSARLERERSRLLDELGRTVNRLDSRSNERRSLELQLHRLPVATPIADANRRRETCRAELSRIEDQLRRIADRQPLEEQRQRLERRLRGLLEASTTSWPLLARASQWLGRLSTGRGGRLEFGADGALRVDGNAASLLGEVERQTLSMALRMAAVDELARQGRPVPMLIDEPPSGLRVGDTPWRLATALARFVEAGRQIVVFTESRPLANAIANVGGRLQSLERPQYIQMRYRDERPMRRSEAPADAFQNINRDLDMVWREANGLYDDPYWYRSEWRHGHDPFSESLRPRTMRRSGGKPRPEARETARVAASPFFLTEESPVDQAPSIDPVIATRLGIIGITRVGHLLVSDPHYIARCLHLSDVTPQVVQRWQNEAQLVCRVPQLRNFDARVLVGCGFTDPKQLAQMHAGHLLEKVEAFLTTERGRQILRSGTSYELSRITSWIAAANRSVARGIRHGERNGGTARVRYEPNGRTSVGDGAAHEEAAEDTQRDGDAPKRSGRRRRADRDGAVRTAVERAEHRTGQQGAGRPRDRRQTALDRADAPRGVVAMHVSEPARGTGSETSAHFHLHRRSPIVDAPAIGPKTAARLARLAIRTVEDLLQADPAVIAAGLGHRKIDAERVRQWQQQATLVCRVPLLRGDHAELLVAVGIADPERLAKCDPDWLHNQIGPMAQSPRGKRILRGAPTPDLAEVSDWIEWAKDRRSLRAA